jgi:hypothetical protein
MIGRRVVELLYSADSCGQLVICQGQVDDLAGWFTLGLDIHLNLFMNYQFVTYESQLH